jgi:hypothetical protein
MVVKELLLWRVWSMQATGSLARAWYAEQGLILAALLGLSAFFSVAETSITTLWPWKV